MILLKKGTTFIYTSSDLDEITLISHRILVLYEGKIVAELDRRDFSKEKLLHYSDGNEQ